MNKNFFWGAATSAAQVEGENSTLGKSRSVWDTHEQMSGRIEENYSFEKGVDHYNRYTDDVALMKKMNLNCYRFSVSWARFMPEGTGKINKQGADFYSRLIDELIKNGIEPFICLFHWDLPYCLYQKGGWLNPQIADWFAEFSEAVVKMYSDKVKYYITLNEPQIYINIGHETRLHAPFSSLSDLDLMIMSHNSIMAHSKACIKMRQSAKQKIYIGIANSGATYTPDKPDQKTINAAREFTFDQDRRFFFQGSWFSDAVIFGDYPFIKYKAYNIDKWQPPKQDLKIMKQPLDFYGQNIYNSEVVNDKREIVPMPINAGRTNLGWIVNPEALYWPPKFMYERYKLPIIITENGFTTPDVKGEDGEINDYTRLEWTKQYIKCMEKAISEGVDIAGYFHWSLMDNFEWQVSYSRRFGMIYVDFETMERTIKRSGLWYADHISKSTLTRKSL